MTVLPKANAQRAGDRRSKNAERRPGTSLEVRKKIDLSEPYETGLTAVLSLPGINHNGNHDQKVAETLRKMFRRVYEAANGRHVSTVMGPIAIAPAVAPWLKNAPLSFGTQQEFFDFVANLNGTPPALITQVNRKARTGKHGIRT